jgi:hypothetical protein
VKACHAVAASDELSAQRAEWLDVARDGWSDDSEMRHALRPRFALA